MSITVMPITEKSDCDTLAEKKDKETEKSIAEVSTLILEWIATSGMFQHEKGKRENLWKRRGKVSANSTLQKRQ